MGLDGGEIGAISLGRQDTPLFTILGDTFDPLTVGNYNEIVILGWDKDGYLDLRVTSGTTIPGLLWLLELTKAKLINGDFSDE
jgi:predicted porin